MEIGSETGKRKAAEAKTRGKERTPIDISYERGRQQGGDQHEEEDGEPGQLGLEGDSRLLQDEVGIGEQGVDPAQLVGEADGKHVEDQFDSHRVTWVTHESVSRRLSLSENTC